MRPTPERAAHGSRRAAGRRSPARTPRASCETRDALLDAAERLFSERGYEGVGIREIAARAGANLAAIQYHFGSKRSLYLETMRRTATRPEVVANWKLLSSAPRDSRGAAAVLVRFVRALVERLLDPGEVNRSACLMLQEALRPSEAVGDVAAGFTTPREDLLADLVRRVAPGTSRAAALAGARSILSQILYFLIFRPFLEQRDERLYSDARRVRATADAIARFSLRGLGLGEARVQRALSDADARPAP